MANNITVAWAIPVDEVALAASIEAYASSKITESAFLEFAETMPENSPVRRLPGELIEKITTHVQQRTFIDQEAKWKEALWCFCGNCSLSKHLDDEDHRSYKANYMEYERIEAADFDEDRFNEWLKACYAGMDNNEHLGRIEYLERKISDGAWTLNDDGEFKWARKLFAEDFGLEIHFQTFNVDPWEPPDYDPRRAASDTFEDRLLLAYLILPARYAVMRVTAAGSSSSFHAAMMINASIRKELTEKQKDFFKKAMRVLNLRPLPIEWTEDRPTTERYTKTNTELGQIKELVAAGKALNGRRSHEAFSMHQKKLRETKWPQLMVFVSATKESE